MVSQIATNSAPALRVVHLVLATVLALAVAVAATAADDWPAPQVNDEFSLILAGQTFATGRLTNTPHPLPQFFEVFHVLQSPSYSSKYYPGLGLSLAIGIVLGGGPRLGQWLAFASMAPALLWMLCAWVPRRIAIVATSTVVLLMADTPLASGYKATAIAVTGAALLLGSYRRLTETPRTGPAVAMGVGLMLLAYSRPFEGFASALPFAAFFLAWCLRDREQRRERLLRVALPCTAVLSIAAGFLASHNHAVTGDVMRSAYSAYEATVPGAPPFVWQRPVGATRPLRPNEQVRSRRDLAEYHKLRSDWGGTMRRRLTTMTLPVYLPWAGFAALYLLVPVALRDRRLWLPAASAAGVGVAVGLSSNYSPLYITPAIPALVLLYAACATILGRFTLASRPVGRMAASVAVAALAVLAIRQLVVRNEGEAAQADARHWSRARRQLATRLAELPGAHLVFVRYEPTYQSRNEWVYNDADFATARVLWAHDRGKQENERLISMEQRRARWLVTLTHGENGGVHVTPYDTSSEGLSMLGFP